VMQATPVTWRLLLESGWEDRKLKVLCGGEALPAELATRLLAKCGSLWNMYGPTETTIWSLACRVGEGPVTLGRPIGNTRVYVLDAQRNPVPIGIPGELYIGGDGLARGYHRRAELTAEKFVPDPFASASGARLYRTGDRCRWRADGELEFLGRTDNQVKVRGFRIELGEVESVLAGHEAVKEAVVVVRPDAIGESQLVGYLTAQPGRLATAESQQEVRAWLREKLPDHMVPGILMVLPQLPLTPNGKVDRNALPAARAEVGERQVAKPWLRYHHEILAVWEEMLTARPIGISDSFFDLGGYSLLAVRMLNRVEKKLGKELPLRVLFESPTIEHLAEHLLAGGRSAGRRDVIEVNPHGKKPPMALLGVAAGNLKIARIVAQDPEQPVYILPLLDLAKAEVLPPITKLASEQLEVLRGLRSQGPYVVAGYCFAGLVAFEMARQLRERGEEVPLLLVLDAPVRDNALSRVVVALAARVAKVRGWNDGQAAVRAAGLIQKAERLHGIFRKPLPEWWGELGLGLKRKSRRWSRSAAPEPTVPVPPPRPMTPWGEPYFRWLLAQFSMKPYAGKAVLIAPNAVPEHPTLHGRRWRRWVPDLTVIPTVGTHRSCIEEHVDHMAGHVVSCLRSIPPGRGASGE